MLCNNWVGRLGGLIPSPVCLYQPIVKCCFCNYPIIGSFQNTQRMKSRSFTLSKFKVEFKDLFLQAAMHFMPDVKAEEFINVSQLDHCFVITLLFYIMTISDGGTWWTILFTMGYTDYNV